MTPFTEPCFFVLGYGRSGTTLVRRMLSAHPRLFVPPENDIFQRLPPHMKGDVTDAAGLEALIAKFPPYYESIYDIEAFRAKAAGLLPLSPPRFFATLLGTAKIGVGKTDPIWGHKRPSEWPYLPTFRRWYPEARYIHVVRQPHDSTASMVRHQLQSYPTTPLVAIWQWRKAYQAIRRHGRAVGPDRYMMLRYEDLVAEPERELIRVCAFLGVAPEADRMIAYREDASAAFVDGGVHMRETHRPLSRERVGAGANEYTQDERALLDHVAQAELQELGYPPRAAAPLPVVRGLTMTLACRGLDVAWEGLRLMRRIRGQL